MTIYWKKFNLIFILTLVFYQFFAAPSNGFTEEIRIVAIVNEEVITSYDLDLAMQAFHSQLAEITNPEQRQFAADKGQEKVLEDMINDRLLNQEMEKLFIQVSHEEIDEELRRITKRSGLTMSQFENILKNRNLTLAQYRKTLKDHLRLLKFIGRKIRPQVQVDEENIKFYYERNKNQFSKPFQVHLIQVTLSSSVSQKTENEVRSDLISAVPFSELKAKYRGVKFYDLGMLAVTDLNRDIQPLISSVEVGKLSKTVTTGKSRNFYQVLKKQENQSKEFAEVREEIRSRLFEKEIEQQVELYIRDLRNSSHVEVKI